MQLEDIKLGIYEKALPAGTDWQEKLSLAQKLNFQFVEMSVDESDERLSRLKWSKKDRNNFRQIVGNSSLTVPSICFSGHRKFTLGSHNPEVRKKSREMLKDAIDLAVDLGVRNIQLAGYDVYYDEEPDAETNNWFVEGIRVGAAYAARENVMLSMEIMDTPYMNSIVRFLNLKKQVNSPWLTVYPDLGNLTAWGNNVDQELRLGIEEITAIHLKDTKMVTNDYPGQFRDLPFGDGCVDFAAAFKTLSQICYTGPFLVEMWTEKADNPELEITNARNWLIDKMREGGYITEKERAMW